MKWTLFAILLGGFFGQSQPVMAEGGSPVVIELYTSQGCSACPPADEFLARLAQRDDVIALALHVDYWDYLGWKDVFAIPQFTQRQKGYARAAGNRSIYTPQMVIAGRDNVVGLQPMQVADLIQAHRAALSTVELTIARTGSDLTIAASTDARITGGAVVQLVTFAPSRTVSIERGENAGKTMTYANVVTRWQNLSDWSGAEPLALTVPLQDDLPLAVIIQAPRQGPILAARMLR